MSGEIVRIQQLAPLAASPNRTDEAIVELWSAGRPAATRRAYLSDVARLFAATPKPMDQITLEDLQAFAARLASHGLAPSTRKRILSAVKSLFSFASDGGIRHVRYNVAAALRLPKCKDTLNQRILTEAQVDSLVEAASGGRNRLMVELLYLSGVRAEEVAGLCWRDAQPDNNGGGVLTIFGKGEKTRNIHLEPVAWQPLIDWRKGADEDSPIFASRNGGGLSTVQVWRIVSGAAKRAGIKAAPHWLRHSHATHAIDHGCDLELLRQSLGHESEQTTRRYVHSRPRKSSGAHVRLRRSGSKQPCVDPQRVAANE